MGQHFLLTGAGFSRNWGGWLVNEAFEYLLGSKGVGRLDHNQFEFSEQDVGRLS